MGWEWRPETPEEIAEHQRMRKNLIECQQMYDNKIPNYNNEMWKSKRTPKSFLLVLAIICFAIYLFYNGGFSMFSSDENKPDSGVSTVQSANDTVRDNQDTDVHYGKSVSNNTSDYIQQVKSINLKLQEFTSKLSTDLMKADYQYYMYDIDDLAKRIEILQKKSIYKVDDLKEYETVCEAYYGRIYTYLKASQQNQTLSVEAFNQLWIELNSLKNPYSFLLELFNTNGYHYYIDSEGTIHYKTKNLLF